METVRFQSTDPREQLFAREIRKRVHSYFKENKLPVQGNYKLYVKTFLMLVLYLAPFIILITVPSNPFPALVLWAIMGVGEAGIGMSVMHDGAHGAYSSKKWINKAAAATMYLLGSNTFNWKLQHNIMHHTFTNIYNYDSDISTKAVIRLCEHAPLRSYHRWQQLYAFPLYGLMTFLKFFGEISVLLKSNRKGITREQNATPSLEVFKLLVAKIVYLALIIGLPLLLGDYSILQVLTGFITLHVVAGIIMSTVFQMAHVVEGTWQPKPDENNVIHTEWIVHQLRATSDFGRNNGLFSWYIGGLDYQIEHHLFPNVSHIHYPSIAPIIEATAKEFGFTYTIKPTFLHALASHFRRLKELGKNPAFSPGKISVMG